MLFPPAASRRCAAGNVNSSIIAAGLDVGDDLFPLDRTETLIAGSKITALFIGKAMSSDSKVLAIKLPARVFVVMF